MTPSHFRVLAEQVAAWRPRAKMALQAGDRCMRLLEGLDALRRPEPFMGFCEASAALENSAVTDHPGCQLLMQARKSALAIRAEHVMTDGLTGPALGEALRAERVRAIAKLLGNGTDG